MTVGMPSDRSNVAESRNIVRRVLDSTDRTLIALLRANSRISNRALAEQLGLSPPACLRRVQRLERDGVILGYTLQLGRPAAGLSAFVGIRLATHTAAIRAEFEQRLSSIEGTVSASQVTGGFDYLIRVEVDDLAAYRRFHVEQLSELPGVAQLTTFVVIEDIPTNPERPADNQDPVSPQQPADDVLPGCPVTRKAPRPG